MGSLVLKQHLQKLLFIHIDIACILIPFLLVMFKLRKVARVCRSVIGILVVVHAVFIMLLGRVIMIRA